MPATLTVDATGQITAWSPEAEELLGYTVLEAIGQPVEIIIPPHLRHRHKAGFARYVETGVSALPEFATTIAVHKSGRQMRLLISVRPVCGEDAKVAAVEATFYPLPDLA